MKNNTTSEMGIMAAIIGLTAAIFGRSKQNKVATVESTGGSMFWNPQAIFIPRRTRFKGYMRENRRSTFNKNR